MELPKDFKVTQSFLKEFEGYIHGDSCGEAIRRRYFVKEFHKGTEAMRLGEYFEYLCTEALPKHGDKPEPKWMKSALKKKEEDRQTDDMVSEYRHCHKQAENFKSFKKELGIEIIEKGATKYRDNLEGTADIIAMWKSDDPFIYDGRIILKKGSLFIIDLKYSAALDKKWDEYGWELNSLPYKNKIMTQAVHYNMIIGLPFFFWVFSSKNESCELIYVNIDLPEYKLHEDRIQNVMDIIEDQPTLFPTPEYNKCLGCVFKDDCKYKHDIPTIKVVNYPG